MALCLNKTFFYSFLVAYFRLHCFEQTSHRSKSFEHAPVCSKSEDRILVSVPNVLVWSVPRVRIWLRFVPGVPSGLLTSVWSGLLELEIKKPVPGFAVRHFDEEFAKIIHVIDNIQHLQLCTNITITLAKRLKGQPEIKSATAV